MIAALLPIAMLTASAPAQITDAAQKASVRAFVAQLYAKYRRNGPGVDRQSGPYTPSLRRLFVLEARQSQGEASVVDWDPVCACQDWDTISVRWLGLDVAARGAVARLELTYGPAISPQRPQRVTLTLERGGAGWLIADIAGAGLPSLRATLSSALKPDPRSKK